MGALIWSHSVSPYEVLHLSEPATSEKIKSAARLLSKVWHPDRFAEQQDTQLLALAHEVQSQVNEARDLLLNPAARKEYEDSRPSGSGLDESELRAARIEVQTLRARQVQLSQEFKENRDALERARRQLKERNRRIKEMQQELDELGRRIAEERARADAYEKAAALQRSATMTAAVPAPRNGSRPAGSRSATIDNRALAAMLRAAGIRPNGAPWQAAKLALANGDDPVAAAKRAPRPA